MHGIEFGVDELIALGAVAEDTIRSLGVSLPGSNRLTQSRALLIESAKSDRHTIREVIDAQQNVIEAYLIAFAASKVRIPALTAKLRALLCGHVALGHDLRSQARDEQFEVLVWAILAMAGIGQVNVAEPDFIVLNQKARIGVAVKRLSSQRSLSRHVQKAAKQIERCGAPIGLLAVNLDVPFRERAEREPNYVNELPALVEAQLDKLPRGRHIDAIMAIGSIPEVSEQGDPMLSYSMAMRVIRVPGAEQQSVTTQLGTIGARLTERVMLAIELGLSSAKPSGT